MSNKEMRQNGNPWRTGRTISATYSIRGLSTRSKMAGMFNDATLT